MKGILDIIIENLTNERLDSIVFANDEYKNLLQKYNESANIFESSLTPEQQTLYNAFTVDYNAMSAMYARLAYELGLRDLAELCTELTAKSK